MIKLPALPKGRELIYALAAAACLCVSLVLIAVMAFSGAKKAGAPRPTHIAGATATPKASAPQTPENAAPAPEIKLDSQTLTALFSLYMTEELPIKDINAEVLEGIIKVEAAVDKEKLEAYLTRMEAPSYLITLAALVPDGTKAGAEFTVDGEEGLTLSLRALSLDGKEISRMILPDSVFQSVDKALGQALFGLDTHIESARTEDGELVITPRS